MLIELLISGREVEVSEQEGERLIAANFAKKVEILPPAKLREKAIKADKREKR